METAFKRMARFLAVGGVASIVFGVIVLFWPGISIVALTYIFGAFAFVYGVFGLGAGLNLLAHKSTDWVAPVLGGAAGVLIGVVTYLHPAVTVLALTYLIAAWSFVTGVAMIMSAIEIWGEVKGALWIVLSGAASILFGALIAVWPGAGLLAILWVISFYAVINGVFQLIGAYRIHEIGTEVKRTMGAPQPAA